jgi:hypothetical protein
MSKTEPLQKILIVEDSELLHRMYEVVFRQERLKGCAMHAYTAARLCSSSPPIPTPT